MDDVDEESEICNETGVEDVFCVDSVSNVVVRVGIDSVIVCKLVSVVEISWIVTVFNSGICVVIVVIDSVAGVVIFCMESAFVVALNGFIVISEEIISFFVVTSGWIVNSFKTLSGVVVMLNLDSVTETSGVAVEASNTRSVVALKDNFVVVSILASGDSVKTTSGAVVMDSNVETVSGVEVETNSNSVMFGSDFKVVVGL